MVLDSLGHPRSQAEIARSLGFREGFGAPASRIAKLRIRGIAPQYVVDGTPEQLNSWLEQGVPVIAFVQAGELPQWEGCRAQHAVLLVGTDRHEVHMHDPAMPYGPIRVDMDDFLLAWQEMDNRYAVLVKQAVKK
jgi:predicted double-glycine peptidase